MVIFKWIFSFYVVFGPSPHPLPPQLSYPHLTHFFISLSLHQSRPALTTQPPSINFLNYSRHTSVKCGCYVKQPMSSYHSQFDELWGWIIQQICYIRLFINALNCWMLNFLYVLIYNQSQIWHPPLCWYDIDNNVGNCHGLNSSKAVFTSKTILQFEMTAISLHFNIIIFALLDTCRINIFRKIYSDV